MAADNVDPLFAGREPQVREIYDRLLAQVRKYGKVKIEAKKTSIHLVAGSAFAGVHPRKSSILLNIRLASAISSARIKKCEQVSKGRFHNELLLTAPSDVDAELARWLADAYDLSAS